jgi:hypothetical protein
MLAFAALPACGGGNAASTLARAPDYAPRDQAKCGVKKSQSAPLIVEWPAAARAELESAAKHGLVAVRYEGCEMEVLAQCRVSSGAYAYTPTTRHRDRVTMRDEDDLYANVPLGAARLGATLKKAGELNVKMTIVGMYQADRDSVRADELSGDCAGATHVVTALSAGAFEFFAGADAAAGAGATVQSIGGEARSEAKRETLNEAGEEAACEKSGGEDKSPPFGCGALVRLEVVPLKARKEVASVVVPEPPRREPPPPASAEPPPPALPSASDKPAPSSEPASAPPPEPLGPRAPATSSSEPPPAPPSTTSNVLYGILGGTLAVGLVAAIVAGILIKKGDTTTPVQRNAGLGSGTVTFTPSIQW